MKSGWLVVVGFWLVLAPGPDASRAQDVPGRGAVRTGVRLSADTVRIGEPFTLGIVAVSADTVRFPPLLDAGDRWEQIEVVRVERQEGAETRAYYRLVAWETGRLDLPDLPLSVGAVSPRTVRLDLPAPFVRSVLPAEAETVELRGPRAPLGRGFPWWWVLAALLLAALLAAWWWRRSRREAVEAAEVAAVPPSAAERARAALVALRERAEAGELTAAQFYDLHEEILRAYLAGTREWPISLPIRSSRWLDRGAMRELHRHAVMSRFAGVMAPGGRLVEDADLSLEWLEKDAA